MLKVLCVDDEVQILEGLKVLIDWAQLGYYIAAFAYNGEQALKAAEECMPDLVITDIRMPVIDGIQLIDILSKKMPETKFLVLSGYSDFEYARDAMNNGAYGYLLKPVEEEELIEFLCKIKKELEGTQKRQEEEVQLRRQLKESMPVLRDRYIMDILTENISGVDNIKTKLEFVGIKADYDLLCTCVIEIDDLNIKYKDNIEEMQLIKYRVKNMIIETFGRGLGCITMNYAMEKILLIIHDTPDSSIDNVIISDLMENLKEKAFEETGQTITIGVGGIYRGLENMRKSYKECIEALKYKLTYGRDTIIFFADINISKEISVSVSGDAEKDIMLSIEIGDKKSLKEGLDRLFQEMFNNMIIEPKTIYNECIYILSGATKIAREMGIDIKAAAGVDIMDMNELSKNKTMDKLKSWVIGVLTCILDSVAERRGNIIKSKIDEIKEYIEKHFSEDISLNVLANKFYMSPFYMSQLFKKETGGNFIDFVTSIRIKNARKLLVSTDMKVYEISENVGYKNSRYFSQIFEKIVGFTPSEYRENAKA